MSNGTCSHAGAVFSSPTLLPEQRMRRYRQTASKLPRYRPAMLFPFAASPYNNLRGAGADCLSRPCIPSGAAPCLKGRTGTLAAYDQIQHAIMQQLPALPCRPTMKLLPVHIHRRPTPPHIRQHKGYIHASPATGTTDIFSGHGPSLCPLPHRGCLLSRTPHGVAE